MCAAPKRCVNFPSSLYSSAAPLRTCGRTTQSFEVGDRLQVVFAAGATKEEREQNRVQSDTKAHQGFRAFVVSPMHLTVISLPSLMP